MAKLSAENIVTGKKFNPLNPKWYIGGVLGVVAGLAVLGMGEHLFTMVTGKLPFVRKPSNPFEDTHTANTAPQITIY